MTVEDGLKLLDGFDKLAELSIIYGYNYTHPPPLARRD